MGRPHTPAGMARYLSGELVGKAPATKESSALWSATAAARRVAPWSSIWFPHLPTVAQLQWRRNSNTELE